jgi:hypothetical protein
MNKRSKGYWMRYTPQSELTTAKAMVFNCMDFRVRNNVVHHLGLKGYTNNFNEVISAGASLGYNGLLDYSGWDTYIDQHITLGYNLHSISEIIIIEHQKCGAYIAQYGNLSPEQEYIKHVENSQLCADILWRKFNPKNGTIIKIPNLVIIVYIITIDGRNLNEIYRKS